MPDAGQCATTTDMLVAVNTVNSNVSIVGSTLTAEAIGATYQWIECLLNQEIQGATTASYTATQNGMYAVVVSEFGCVDTSMCTLISTIGLNDLEMLNLNVYPNPVQDVLMIDVDNEELMSIVDLTGNLLKKEILHVGHNEMTVTDLSTGVYMLRTESGQSMKFIKQ